MAKGRYTLKEQVEALEKEVTRLVKLEIQKHEKGIRMTDKWRNHVWALRFALNNLKSVANIQNEIKSIFDKL